MTTIEQEETTKGNGKSKKKGTLIPDGVKPTVKKVEVKEFRLARLGVWLVGSPDSPLVVHKFSEKHKKMMLDKQMGVARHAKEKKDPVAEYDGARYMTELPDGRIVDAFPAATIKKSLVEGCRLMEDLSMTLIRQVVRVTGELIPIQRSPGIYYFGEPESKNAPVKREDTVRVGGKGPGTGTADLRYRPEYGQWCMYVELDYLENMLSSDQLVNLINVSGFGSGIGENRPGKTGGAWGCYQGFSEREDVVKVLKERDRARAVAAAE